MTELSFLIDLLMNHKLPKATRDLIVSRIKEVEENINKSPFNLNRVPAPPGLVQAASTLALMEKHGPLLPSLPSEIQIAQTPQTAAALEHSAAVKAGKLTHDPLTGRPRKF